MRKNEAENLRQPVADSLEVVLEFDIIGQIKLRARDETNDS